MITKHRHRSTLTQQNTLKAKTAIANSFSTSSIENIGSEYIRFYISVSVLNVTVIEATRRLLHIRQESIVKIMHMQIQPSNTCNTKQTVIFRHYQC